VARLSWPPAAVAKQDQPAAVPPPAAPPAKGKPPPPPGGKGKAPTLPPPPKGGKCPPSAKKACGLAPVCAPPPFARRLHWRALPDEGLAATAFSQVDAEALVDDKAEEKHFLSSLQALFTAPRKEITVSSRALPPPPRKEITLLSQVRAQNILIALQRQPVTSECLQALIDLRFQADALDCCGLSSDSCEVLLGVAPTPEEVEKLLGYSGDLNDLRDAERKVLPLARMQRPSAEIRLQLAVFSHKVRDLAGRLRMDLTVVTDALATARSGFMFRTVLRRALHLGNTLNHGRSGRQAAGGFAVADGLPKLSLCRAVSNPKATLLHVLVAHLVAWDPAAPGRLREELGATRVAASRPLALLAEDVATFRRQASEVARCAAEAADTAVADALPSLAPIQELVTRSAEEAVALESSLGSLRDEADLALKFFGEVPAAAPSSGTPSVTVAEVFAKSADLLAVLASFLEAFLACSRELDACPSLAALCRGSRSPRSPSAPRE